MRWDDFRRSDNIEDRRGLGGGAVGGMGIGTVVVLGLIGWALGIDPRILIGGAEVLTGNRSGYESPAQPGPTGAPSDQLGQFVSAVLGDTEDRWKELFKQAGAQYREPKLVFSQG
jgi:predicted metalloprotease